MPTFPVPLRRLTFVLLSIGLTAIPSTGYAATGSANYLAAAVSADAALVAMYGYGTGTPMLIATQADWSSGSFDGTEAATGVLALERSVEADPDLGLSAWWDTDWMSRQCFEVAHTGPAAGDLAGYPIRLTPDLASFAGIRAVAADDATVLPHWVDGPDVWVRMGSIPAGAGTHVCLYADNAAATDTSNLSATVTSALQPRAATVTENAAGRSVTVVSYTDGNVISSGRETVYGLDTGDSYTFTVGITARTVFSSIGPFSSRIAGQAADVLVPLAWSGTEFVVPSTRGTQRFSVFAPGPDAIVTLYRGSAGSTVTVAVPAGTTRVVNADGGSRAVVVTSDAPILLAHEGTNNRDVYGVYPATTADLFGIPSTRHYVSTNTDGTGVTVHRSDGTTRSSTVNRFARRTITPNGATYGNGPAARITGSAPIGSIQQADGNGSESTTFLPSSAQASAYRLPTAATYVAFACPTPGTTIEVVPPTGSPGALTCSSPGAPYPGKARTGKSAAGTIFRSTGGEVFYAYYQDNATVDETNLVGPVTGEAGWPAPSAITARGVTGIYRPAGTWTSPVLDTGGSGVFGLFEWAADAPAGTVLGFQIASAPMAGGPFTFRGPDGTGATFYRPGAEPAIVHYAHDGDRYVQVRVVLESTSLVGTPEVDELSVEADLPPLSSPLGEAVPVAVFADGTIHPLVRVRSNGTGYGPPTAHLRHVGGANLANIASAELAFDAYPAAQLEYATGAVVTALGADEPFSPPDAYSITLSENTISTGQASVLDIVWRLTVPGGFGAFIERPLEVTIVS